MVVVALRGCSLRMWWWKVGDFAVEVGTEVLSSVVEIPDEPSAARGDVGVAEPHCAVQDSLIGVEDPIGRGIAESEKLRQRPGTLQGVHSFRARDPDLLATLRSEPQQMQLPLQVRRERLLNHAYPEQIDSAVRVALGELLKVVAFALDEAQGLAPVAL